MAIVYSFVSVLFTLQHIKFEFLVIAAFDPFLPSSFGSTLILAGPEALRKTFMLTRLKGNKQNKQTNKTKQNKTQKSTQSNV